MSNYLRESDIAHANFQDYPTKFLTQDEQKEILKISKELYRLRKRLIAIDKAWLERRAKALQRLLCIDDNHHNDPEVRVTRELVNRIYTALDEEGVDPDQDSYAPWNIHELHGIVCPGARGCAPSIYYARTPFYDIQGHLYSMTEQIWKLLHTELPQTRPGPKKSIKTADDQSGCGGIHERTDRSTDRRGEYQEKDK